MGSGMTPILVLIQPFDITANARVDVRIGSTLESEAYGLGGLEWKPALIERPQMSIEIMSTDISGRAMTGRTRFTMSLENAGITSTRSLKWGGAPVKIYSAKVLAWPAVTEFDGEITDQSYDFDKDILTITAEVSTSLIEKPLLTLEFDGSTGIGGDAAKRGTLKPAGFGICENIPPVWFDATRNIGMIDGYANCTAISKLMEGASDMGASIGDYASYAALAAAIDAHTIPPGRWGTCIAVGLVGLGAPPVGTIGVNATFGTNRLGAMMSRILTTHAGVSGGQIDSASFTALDTALNYPTHHWTDSQIECKALLEDMARSGNATLMLTFQRKVAVSRVVASSSLTTLDRSGGQVPRCIEWKMLPPLKPVWRIKARAARPAQVLTFDQVNYVDTIIDRGAYSGATVYRAGNLVWLADKSSWLYINTTALSGNSPPTWPTTSNAYWQNIAPPLEAAAIGVEPGATVSDNLIRNSSLSSSTADVWSGTMTRTAGVAANNDPLFFARSTGTQGGYINSSGKLPCIPGATLFLSALVRDATASASNLVRFTIAYYKADASSLSSVSVDTAINSTAWVTRKNTAIIPAGAASYTMQIFGVLVTGSSADIAAPRDALTEGAADVTSQAQVTVDLSLVQKSVEADYLGVLIGSPMPVTFSPNVKKGGASVKLDNSATYAITKPSDGTTGADGGTVTVDNTNGSSTKGDASASAFDTGSILIKFRLTVSYSALVVGVFDCIVNKNIGAAPTGGGIKLATVPANQSTSSTSYVDITSVAHPSLVLASGEKLYASMTALYAAGSGTGVRTGTFKHQYSTDNATWTDFGSAATGSNATAGRYGGAPDYEWVDPVDGYVTINQSVSGLSANTYYFRTIFLSSNSSREIIMSGDTITYEAKA